ncbi:IS630 family transposase, partial [bacterium]|nr:IS630 family transposase [bacterium]
TFKISNDKRFADKLEDIIGLYLNPPEHALVLSCDEKSQMQALERTQPGLPLKKGRSGTMTHDYKRNGTTSLFTAINVMDGTVIGTCMSKHRHQEWIKFLNLIKSRVPSGKEIHIIYDNYATHKHQKVKDWLKRNKRFHVHFTPTSASWLKMVERFFRDISEKGLKRGMFKSLEDFTKAVEVYIDHHNDNPQPFIWTAKANDVLGKVKSARRNLNKLQTA